MGLGSAIDKGVTPLTKRGDRKFLELTGSAKETFSTASRIPDVVSAQNVQAAAAAAEQAKIQTQHKKEIGKHLERIMKEAQAQHELHSEHQQKAMAIALEFAATDKQFVGEVAKYAQQLGIIRAESQAIAEGYDSRMKLELGAIGF